MQRPIATLWIGGRLSWLEQVSLASFVSRGHGITLYAYDEVTGVPPGVEVRDGREIVDTDDFIKYEKKDSYALFADWFRVVMTEKRPGTIWVDTDVYCVRPPDYPNVAEGGHVFGLESPSRINNAVLGLEHGSELQEALLSFMADRFPLPGFLPPKMVKEYREKAAAGDPVHVSRMPWGVWGPMMITAFAKKLGLTGQALPQSAFYPVHFREKAMFLEPAHVAWRRIAPETTLLHLWASNKRELGGHHDGLPPPGSFLDMICRAEGIDPAEAPITERGRLKYPVSRAKPAPAAEPGPRATSAATGDDAAPDQVRGVEGDAAAVAPGNDAQHTPAPDPGPGAATATPDDDALPGQARDMFVAEVMGALDRDEVDTVADLGGSAPDLCLALFRRYDCDLTCVDLDGQGEFPEAVSPATRAWMAAMVAGGVPVERLHLITSLRNLGAHDVVVTLDGFGARHRIARLDPHLDRLLHSGSRLVLDIRKGSGAFPFLKARGGANTVASREVDGKPHARVVLTVEPGAVQPKAAAGQWAEIATGLAGTDGWFEEGEEHSFLFVPRPGPAGRTLVVTFDNLDIAMDKRDDRRPWGWSFIEGLGHSAMGVLAGGWTWFRDPFVSATFARLRDEGFFAGFERVVFYGASMGGYGAAAFSPAAPGCTVVAISPQSTLDKAVVPWETRYRTAWNRDFSGEFGDAARAVDAAGRMHLFHDPYVDLDARHAARFDGANVTRWRCPLMGHRLGSSLGQMGVLSEVVTRAMEDRLEPAAFHGLLRARRGFPRYERELANLALERGHEGLALRVAEHVLSTRPNERFFRQLRRRLKP